MLEACRNLNSDLEQINKLYDIIQKEIGGRFTKRLYKENYNKEYLLELENTSNEANLDQARVRTNSIAVMNLNYWRIEGIRRIYDAFDSDIAEIYGRDLSEFQPVEKVEQEPEIEETFETIVNSKLNEKIEILDAEEDEPKVDLEQSIFDLDESENEDKQVPKIVKNKALENENIKISNFKTIENTEAKKSKKKKSKYGVLKSSKQALANAIYISLQTHEFSPKSVKSEDEDFEQIPEEFEDNEYSDLDAKIDSLDFFDDEKHEKVQAETPVQEEKEAEETEEESVIDLYFKEQSKDTKKRKNTTKIEEDVSKTGNIFKKIIGINSKKKREV